MTWGHEQKGVPIAGGAGSRAANPRIARSRQGPENLGTKRWMEKGGNRSLAVAGRIPARCWSNPHRRVPETRGAADSGDSSACSGARGASPDHSTRDHRPTPGRDCPKPAPGANSAVGSRTPGELGGSQSPSWPKWAPHPPLKKGKQASKPLASSTLGHYPNKPRIRVLFGSTGTIH